MKNLESVDGLTEGQGEETSSFGTVIGRLCGSNLQEIIMSIFIFC